LGGINVAECGTCKIIRESGEPSTISKLWPNTTDGPLRGLA
jgi:hypothetical protein